MLAIYSILASGQANAKTTYKVDIGGPLDELFIIGGFYDPEGPYEQFNGIWKDSRCRWAGQGARVRIPVFPGVINSILVRAAVNGDGQRLRCFINGHKVADFPENPEFIYSFDVSPNLLGDSGWAELKFETEKQSYKGPGDWRDTRLIVDYIEISADAPGRFYFTELVLKHISKSRFIVDKAPNIWRFAYDPNNIGDTFGINRFDKANYDDSGFEDKPTEYLPRMRRGDAAWYRTWVLIDKNLDSVRKELKLPGEEFEKNGYRKVLVNGELIVPEEGVSTRDKAAKALKQGPNIIIVKVMQGPLPKPTGDIIINQPKFEGEWLKDKVLFSPGTLIIADGRDVSKISIELRSPGGACIGSARADIGNLDDGKRGVNPNVKWAFGNEFGEYSFIVRDDRNREQRFPVHYLGIHFFHWGWYSRPGGWSGFQPCSNDYLDQLFDKIDDWSHPHHSITWQGTILDPGTGFHDETKVDYIAKFREAIASGQLDFVGSTFPPRNVCTDFGETLIRSLRMAKSLYNSQLNCNPLYLTSHDATLTPQYPQIMALCGYDSYVLPDNWWGQGRSIPSSRDCYWQGFDGTAVRCLDSWYHGTWPTTQARRAVEQGKPAVLCNEEFACLDATLFLYEHEVKNLAGEGIFLRPVSLDEYKRITDAFAKEYTHTGDEKLCYKGWTGGGEGEVEFDKFMRKLENKLVALDNLIAFARAYGIEIDQLPVDKWWNDLLRHSECHLHWGNGWPEFTAKMKKGIEWADAEIIRVSELIAQKTKASSGDVVVFNPVGFERDGIVQIDPPAYISALKSSDNKLYPLQADPDNPGKFLAFLPKLPSIGYRSYKCTSEAVKASSVNGKIGANGAVLDNGIIRVDVAADGSINSIVDAISGETLIKNANVIYLARPHDKVLEGHLSTEENQLNRDFYSRPVAVEKPELVCQGPVMAAVECNAAVRDYPNVKIKIRVSLGAGERQARIRFSLNFPQSTPVWPRNGNEPHEGVYLPGIWASFPMTRTARPIADMAYCVTENSLSSTNHETFLNISFRNCTFNALSLAGTNSGEYAILTRGLTDFFALRNPEPVLGLSFGVGSASCPYNGSYTFEYAVFVPRSSERKKIKQEAYKAAQSFLIDAVAVNCNKDGSGQLPLSASFVTAKSDSVIITGVQKDKGQLEIRVLNLENKPKNVKIDSLIPLNDASVRPNGKIENGKIELAPYAVREIVK